MMKKELLPYITFGLKSVDYTYCDVEQIEMLEEFIGYHQLQVLRINGETQLSIVNYRGIQRFVNGDVIVKFTSDSFAIIPAHEFDKYLKEEEIEEEIE